MTITLNADQQRGVEMAVANAHKPGRVVVLGGYAGTGKTTAEREILDRLPGTIGICPTGRAALRASARRGTRCG